MGKAFRPHEYANCLVQSGGYASDKSLLYRWTGTHWCPLDEDAAKRDAYHWIVARETDFASDENARKAIRAAMLFLARVPDMSTEVVIPCTNGYVHLDDDRFVLREADPALGLQHVLSCRYDPATPAPVLFHRFLDRALPDKEVQARVQEYIGYTLMSDARFQRAQLWLGEGANGKGVLANIVQALHGNIAAVSLDALEGFKLSVLIGASLVYADEVPRARFNEQLLKSMIAGERVQIDRKHKDPLSIHVRGKWLVLGNHLPPITDHSTGFWRRWDIVPFGATVPAQDRDPMLAAHIISHELGGVLHWALDGLQRLLLRGHFDPTMPKLMADLLQEVKAETNSVHAWMVDCGIEIGHHCETSKDAVFAHFRRWCERNALGVVGSVQFWKRLRELLRSLEDGRSRRNGTQIRVCNIVLPGVSVEEIQL